MIDTKITRSSNSRDCRLCHQTKDIKEFPNPQAKSCSVCLNSRPLCRICKKRPSAWRYSVCQKCRHGDPVPCPNCTGSKRPEAILCKNCHRKSNRGPEHNCWKGGRIIDGQGYIRIWCPQDPRANCGRYMKEHVLVMEELIGRKLIKGETVHHKNGDRGDNRPENLELWVKSQPAGQRVEDKIKWAIEILERYRPSIITVR